MSIPTLITTAGLLAAASAQAAISVTSPAFTYAQGFDSLANAGTGTVNWANDSTIAGWSLFTSTGTPAPTYLVSDGGSNTGSFYSFGSIGSAERALGSVASGGAYFGSPASGATAGYIAASFSNDTGGALAGFTLAYAGEQWRNGGNANLSAQSLTLEYAYGAAFPTSGWAAAGPGFNFTSPVTTATAGAVDGNGVGRVSGLGGTVGTSWAAGATLWLRWVDLNDAGNDHGLAIDNFSLSVSAVPEPGAGALLLAGLGVLGFVARRRR